MSKERENGKSRWAPAVEKIIEQMNNQFNQKIKDNQRNVDLDNKIKGLFESIEEKFLENCKSNIDVIQKIEEATDQNGQALKEGKLDKDGQPGQPNQIERDMYTKEQLKNIDAAYEQLEECKKPYINMINNFTFISQFTRRLFKLQTDYCYDECNEIYEKVGKKSEKDLRNCINTCSQHLEKFAFKASSDLLESTAESFKNELDKLKKL